MDVASLTYHYLFPHMASAFRNNSAVDRRVVIYYPEIHAGKVQSKQITQSGVVATINHFAGNIMPTFCTLIATRISAISADSIQKKSIPTVYPFS